MSRSDPGGAVEIYSLGIMSCSVCASDTLAHQEVCDIVNQLEPVSGDWQPSKDEYFHARSGEDQKKVGCVCESNPKRRHWLMEC